MEKMPHCARQEIGTIPPSLLNYDVLQIKDILGNPLYHTPYLPDRFVPGKVGCFSSSLRLPDAV